MNTNDPNRYLDAEALHRNSVSDTTHSHLPPSLRLSIGSNYHTSPRHDIGGGGGGTSATSLLDPRVVHTLSKLVQVMTSGNEENMNPKQKEQRQQDLLENSARILVSQSRPTLVEDQFDIVHSIRQKLMINPKNSAKALKFGHLNNKLNTQKVLVKKWSILYLLHLLGDQNEPSTSPSSLKRDSSQFLSPGLPSLSTEQHSSSTSPVRSRDMINNNNSGSNHSQESPRIRRRLTRESPPSPPKVGKNTNKDRSLPAAIQLAKARKQQEMEQDMDMDRMNITPIKVPDALLLRDLIYIFQGIDGQYITFDSANNEYILDPQVSVPKPTQDLVYRVAELGWLYRHVQSFIDTNVDQLSMGLVGQSFCSALQSELMEYYKHIAILEAQIEKQPQFDTEFIPNEQTLTLKRLLVWTQESLQRLKLMSVLVDVSQDQKGGALVSTMHNYTNHGDPFFKRYISDMLQEVSKPFYEMLKRWISEGELDDPYGEFFVAIDPTVTEEELWQRKYTLREDMLPSFISSELAQKIFSIGKSLNFIRYSCHDETLVEKYYAENSTTLPWHTFKYGDIQTIEVCVDAMYLETSNQLLSLLKNKYKLMDHLLALKRYLLLGQGDFIQYLMGTLGPTLSQPANTLIRHNLTGVLETAIRASNAQFDDTAILNRLDVRLLEVSTDDLGWDVFTLDYHADSPINTVLSPPMMNQYLLVFNFLWRLKRVEYTLTAAWRRWGTASRTFASVPELSQDLHEAQMVIASMIHFIYQLQHYYLFEVLECAWEKLETRINTKSIDLDSVIEAHSQYLSDIAYRGFLASPKHKPLFKQLNTIFDVVLTYKTILDHLFNYGTSELSKKPTSTSDIDKLTKIRSNLNGVSTNFKTLVDDFLKVSRDLGFKIIK